jgi:hypothetical protein
VDEKILSESPILAYWDEEDKAEGSEKADFSEQADNVNGHLEG